MSDLGDTVYRRREQTVTAALGREMAALDLATGAYLGFNATATEIWRLLEHPQTASSLCAGLQERFAVDEETCRASVSRILDRLLQHNLIVCDG
jgi:hypothetical protein